VDTSGKDAKKIAEYIKHQLDEDKLGEQLKIPDTRDPFTGGK
jgi:putative transposase